MKSALFLVCFFSALLAFGAEAQTICGRAVCQPNQYCYSPYPAINACYNYRNYGESCYKRGLYLCAPGLECAVAHTELGACVFATTTAAPATTTPAAGNAPTLGLSPSEQDSPLLNALLKK